MAGPVIERRVLFRMLGIAFAAQVRPFIQIGRHNARKAVGEEVHQLFMSAADAERGAVGRQAPQRAQTIQRLVEFPDLAMEVVGAFRKSQVRVTSPPQWIATIRHSADLVERNPVWVEAR
jgi:hypothetical protein